MKKCPFCAEEIQDNAIKCKHCGEWFSKSQSLREGEQESAEREVCTDETCTGIFNADGICNVCRRKKGELPQNILNEKIVEKIIPAKKTGKGWGWFLVLVLYASTFKDIKNIQMQGFIIYVLNGLGWIPALFIYFKLRKFFVDIKTDTITRLSSFKAGAVIYIFFILPLYALTVFLNAYLGNNSEKAYLEKQAYEILKNASLEKINSATKSLEEIDDYGTLVNIEKGLNFIKDAKNEYIIVKDALTNFNVFVDKNSDKLKSVNLSAVIELQNMIEYSMINEHLVAVGEYVVAVENILNYKKFSFEKLKKNSEPENTKFNELYNILEATDKKQADTYSIKVQRTKEFLERHPEIVKLLSDNKKAELGL